MAHNVYISAAEARSGKSFIVLGVMRSLLQQVQRVAIFRPIINTAPEYGEWGRSSIADTKMRVY